MNFLERVAAVKKEEVEFRRRRKPLETGQADFSRPDFLHGLLARPGGLIAEVKKASPSEGRLKELDAGLQARGYAAGGAAAISVLTDRQFFGGDQADLLAVTRAVELPVLCKDFVIDAYQIGEAAALGASAVLIIVALNETNLPELIDCCREKGVTPLVEVHTFSELNLALKAKAPAIAVNNRNLKTLEVDLMVCRKLLPDIPAGIPAIAASGLTTAREVKELLALGYKGVLVGTALMKKEDPRQAVESLLAGIREV